MGAATGYTRSWWACQRNLSSMAIPFFFSFFFICIFHLFILNIIDLILYFVGHLSMTLFQNLSSNQCGRDRQRGYELKWFRRLYSRKTLCSLSLPASWARLQGRRARLARPEYSTPGFHLRYAWSLRNFRVFSMYLCIFSSLSLCVCARLPVYLSMYLSICYSIYIFINFTLSLLLLPPLSLFLKKQTEIPWTFVFCWWL